MRKYRKMSSMLQVSVAYKWDTVICLTVTDSTQVNIYGTRVDLEIVTDCHNDHVLLVILAL